MVTQLSAAPAASPGEWRQKGQQQDWALKTGPMGWAVDAGEVILELGSLLLRPEIVLHERVEVVRLCWWSVQEQGPSTTPSVDMIV